MGSYREIEGDLLELFDKGEFDIIGHGCNCQNKMGAGIARQIKDKYITAYLADFYDKREPIHKFGSFSFDVYKGILNLYTQYIIGKNFDPLACTLALRQVAMTFTEDNKIGLPQIGCGIGGGNWEEVKLIIQKELKDFDLTVVIYKLKENE